jgi:hypothetical protein
MNRFKRIKSRAGNGLDISGSLTTAYRMHSGYAVDNGTKNKLYKKKSSNGTWHSVSSGMRVSRRHLIGTLQSKVKHGIISILRE